MNRIIFIFVALLFTTVSTFVLAQEESVDSLLSSDADRIRDTRAELVKDQTRLAELELALVKAETDYEADSNRFDVTDEKVETLQRETPQDPNALTQAKLLRDEAKQQFDLTIQRRQTLRQQLTTLKQRIDLKSQLLEQISTPTAPQTNGDVAVAAAESVMSPAASDSSDVDTASNPESTPPAAPMLPLPGNVKSPEPVLAAVDNPEPPTTEELPLELTDFASEDPALISLRHEVESKRAQLESLRVELELRDENLSTLQTELKNTEALVTNERESLQLLSDPLERLRASNDLQATTETGETVASAIAKLEQRQQNSREALSTAINRSEQLQQQITETERTRKQVAVRADELSAELRTLSGQIWFLESPIAPRNIYRWTIRRGPVVVAILLLASIAIAVTRFIGRRIVAELVRRSRRGSKTEREERAETLRRVFQSATQTFVVVLASLALLQQLGVDVTVLVGGAAVIGMAIAFGAQNLIKDYFTGFMILVENQYSVGNIIRIGDSTGVVENITMRMTVLRDLEGVVHFIPHGNVTQVSNLTHGWSRVVLDIGVAYKENVDRVMEVLKDLLIEIRDDERFGPMVLGEPEILGVDEFADFAVLIKLLIKTRPLKQWEVKRELLRRIKNRFDKLGIEIPIPHLTVMMREEANDNPRRNP